MDNQEQLELDKQEALLKEKLLKNALQGSMVSNWVKHPAFKVYEDILLTYVQDAKNTWLLGDDDKAKQARYEARGVMKALKVLDALKNRGQAAKIKLNELKEDF